MASVTVKSSGEHGPGANGVRRGEDRNGRTVAIRKLSVLDQIRLLKLLGHHNSAYYAFCSQMAAVAEIGGESVHVPQSEREIEAIAQRLGEEGIETVAALHREGREVSDAEAIETAKK